MKRICRRVLLSVFLCAGLSYGFVSAGQEKNNAGAVTETIRVACIGDSITYGVGILDREVNSYPAVLGKMLGSGWDVRNFGVSGATMVRSGDLPYWEQGLFKEALEFKPDVVVIKLGTNDTKPQNWDKAAFEKDCKEMIDRFAALETKPVIYLCRPVPAFEGRWGISEEIIKKQVLPVVDKVAGEKRLPVIDLYGLLSGRKDVFPDTVHPNAEGARLMAEEVGAVLAAKMVCPDVFGGALSDWYGYAKYDFEFDGRSCCVVVPKAARPEKYWIWRARFFGHEPQTDIALLRKGFYLVYMDVAGLYGSDTAVSYWNEFYDYLTEEHGFWSKAVLEGMSRGGLIIFNWAAANPDKTACIYADAPVCDIKSWPGGKGKGKGDETSWRQCLDAYGLTEEDAMAYRRNPIDNLEGLAEAKVPILCVCGAADEVVPMDENTNILEKRYKAMGGEITVIAKEGVGHHPHSLKDPAVIVDFIMGNTISDAVPDGEVEPVCVGKGLSERE